MQSTAEVVQIHVVVQQKVHRAPVRHLTDRCSKMMINALHYGCTYSVCEHANTSSRADCIHTAMRPHRPSPPFSISTGHQSATEMRRVLAHALPSVLQFRSGHLGRDEDARVPADQGAPTRLHEKT